MPKACIGTSIIVSTKNRKELLEKSVNAMLSQECMGKYEVIIVDDGSTDGTFELAKKLEKANPNVRALRKEKSSGPAAGRNLGIRNSKAEFIVILDDDCVPEKGWLEMLLKPFSNHGIAVSSSFSYYGGTSTAYRKEVLEKIGLFDEDFPSSFREDTDTIFKILDLGYKVELLPHAGFEHFHNQPKTMAEKIKYGINRALVHSVDPLLYKKHPERTKEFLDIRFGFIRNPWKDFEAATGLWFKRVPQLKLGSPQGVTLIENKTPIHALAIIFIGLGYVVLVKFARLYGSFKYGKLLL